MGQVRSKLVGGFIYMVINPWGCKPPAGVWYPGGTTLYSPRVSYNFSTKSPGWAFYRPIG